MGRAAPHLRHLDSTSGRRELLSGRRRTIGAVGILAGWPLFPYGLRIHCGATTFACCVACWHYHWWRRRFTGTLFLGASAYCSGRTTQSSPSPPRPRLPPGNSATLLLPDPSTFLLVLSHRNALYRGCGGRFLYARWAGKTKAGQLGCLALLCKPGCRRAFCLPFTLPTLLYTCFPPPFTCSRRACMLAPLLYSLPWLLLPPSCTYHSHFCILPYAQALCWTPAATGTAGAARFFTTTTAAAFSRYFFCPSNADWRCSTTARCGTSSRCSIIAIPRGSMPPAALLRSANSRAEGVGVVRQGTVT